MGELDAAVEHADLHALAGRTVERPRAVDAVGQGVVEGDRLDVVPRQGPRRARVPFLVIGVCADLGGLRWAVEQGYDVINMSLSTTKRQFAEVLHDLADTAYFKRTVLVASAHNMPVESYPWRFSSVISVGSHEEDDPLTFYANPDPPVEFFARGMNVDVAWLGGETVTATGNSFATPAISGIAALVLSKHPRLTPFQLKSVLYQISSNVGGNQ